MKNPHYTSVAVPFLIILACFLFANNSIAQTDTTQVIQPDTIVQTDTIQVVPTDTIAQQLPQETDDTTEKKEKKKKKNSFKVYAGANINTLAVSSDHFESNSDLGFQFGAAYKSGGFFYWEIGARYNNPYYDISSRDTTSSIGGSFGVSQIDIPVTAGINFLSATARLVGLRVFVSAAPSFVIGVSAGETNITKDDLNSFILNGAAGIGVDVAFFFLEAG
ncbi:MAG: hypothetical protein DRI69_08650, partial [Bacteroidetes bacterium]